MLVHGDFFGDLYRSGGLHGAEKKMVEMKCFFWGICLVSGKELLFGNRKFWVGIFRSKIYCVGIFLGGIMEVCMEGYDGGAHRGMVQYTKTGG